MKLERLTCPNCGAPVPPPDASHSGVVCSYCQKTSVVAATANSAEHVRELSTLATKRQFQDRLEAFEADFKKRTAAGLMPYPALREAAAQELDLFGQSEALANVVFALATDIDTENGTTCRTEPGALTRLALGYVDAVQHLRDSAVTEHVVNLPFLSASDSGPVHFERVFTAALIAQLAARPGGTRVSSDSVSPEPEIAQEPELAQEPEAAPAPKKKSFWKRFF